MKRILALLFAAALLCACWTAALAEGEPDLSGMTDAELLELRQAIGAELTARGVFAEGQDELYPGVYEVGKDIRAGDFLFTLKESTRTWVELRLYASAEDYEEDEEPEREYVTSDLGSTFNLLLTDGMVLRAEDGVFLVSERGSVGWRP